MKCFYFIAISLYLLLGCFTVRAANYYISPSGSDGNTGLSTSAAWKTLAKLSYELGGVNGTWGNIEPGSKIYFERGGVYEGTIIYKAYNNQEIEFGAYGTGAKPIIKGAVAQNTGWTLVSAGLYSCNPGKAVYDVYVNGKLQTLARFPNTGYLNVVSSTSTSVTGGSSISSSGLNFVGAYIVMREYDWLNYRKVITSRSTNTLNWSGDINAPYTEGNFFVNNSYALLDVAGEWYQNPTTFELFYRTPNADAPSNYNIEVVVQNYGLESIDNRFETTIKNLDFRYFALNGISLMGAAFNSVVDSCSFSYCGTAVFLSGNTVQFKNNVVNNIYTDGIVTSSFQNGLISNSTFKNVGMVFGHTSPAFVGSFYPQAVYVINSTGGGQVIGNQIDSVGYIGIKVTGEGVLIKQNKVNQTMLNMSDGGAIYLWGASTTANVIKNNIVTNVKGDKHGTTSDGIGIGIYIDNYAHDNLIEYNSVSGVNGGTAILINAATQNHTIRGNTIYGGQILFADWMAQAVSGNITRKNIITTNNVDLPPIQYTSAYGRYNLSNNDSNSYINPYATNKDASLYNYVTHNYMSLSVWQATYPGQDLHSTRSKWLLPNKTAEPTGAELVSNGNFTSNLNEWGNYNSGGTASITQQASQTGYDGGVLKHTANLNSGDIALVGSNSFQYTLNQGYKVVFKASATVNMNLLVQIKRNYGNYAPIQTLETVALTSTPTTYELLITSTVTENPSQIIFQINQAGSSTFYLDDVSIVPSTISAIDPLTQLELFTNSTSSTINVNLPNTHTYYTLDSTVVTSLSIPAYNAKILRPGDYLGPPLPVLWQYFRAQRVGKHIDQVQLNWATVQEWDNSGFELQYALDGKEFRPLTFVKALHNAAGGAKYGYLDNQTQACYYRLKQIDLNGKFTYSPIVFVDLGSAGGIDIYPNPSTGIINIINRSKSDWVVLDLNGNEVAKYDAGVLQSDLTILPSGVYYIGLANMPNGRMVKWVKQ